MNDKKDLSKLSNEELEAAKIEANNAYIESILANGTPEELRELSRQLDAEIAKRVEKSRAIDIEET
ncbi:MAG: hypothetical protein M3R47_02090 [Chloroflexota bacterium]|nr:hypothetical protein [Chloroflexota bacterium]